MKRILLSGVALLALTFSAQAGDCPALTVEDAMGIPAGAYPQQFDLAEIQAAGNCTISFQENPAIGDLNGKIRGNPALPSASAAASTLAAS